MGAKRQWNIINIALYKRELAAFIRMHGRVVAGKVKNIDWERSPIGFINFLNHIGIIPNDLAKPSIGRKNHSRGYAPGNVQWEEYAVNSVKRRGTRYRTSTSRKIKFKKILFRRDSPEATKFRLKNLCRYWRNPVNRAKRSALLRKLWRSGTHSKRGKR